MVLRQQQCATVSLTQLFLLEQHDRLIWQIEQAQQVRYGDPAASYTATHLLARETQLLDQGCTGACLLDGIEILPRHVLDQREFESRGVVARAHQRWYLFQSGD